MTNWILPDIHRYAMKTDVEKQRRRSIRLRKYDYRQAGAYFITVVAHGRAVLFGEIAGGETQLNEFGRIVERAWADLPEHYLNVQCDAFVVMPNHIHGIIVLGEPIVGAGLKPAPTRRHGLPEIVRALKHSLPAGSMKCVILPAPRCGSAIITNMWFVTMENCCAFVNMFSTTPWIGKRTERIRRNQ